MFGFVQSKAMDQPIRAF